MIQKTPLFKSVLIISGFALILFSACQQDNTDNVPCQTTDYGQVPVMPLPDGAFPFHDGEALIFKDSLHHELRFEMDAKGVYSFYSLHSSTSSSSQGCNGYSAYLQSFNTKFHSDSSNLELLCSFQANMAGVNDTSYFYDGMYPSVQEVNTPITSWLLTLSYIANTRGNEAFVEFHPHSQFADVKNFLGKDFTKVYSDYESDGEIHFSQELGFVAFRKDHGTLWVLDRTE
jgi:hypothetical protein